MFFKVLEKIRKKPAHTKRVFSLVVSGVFTGVVAIVWMYFFSSYISENLKGDIAAKLYEPIHKMGDLIGNGMANISAKQENVFKEVKEVMRTANQFQAVDIQDSASVPEDTRTYDSNLKDQESASSTSTEELIQ